MTSPPRTHEVHIERVLPAPPERVWQAISNPAEVSQWLTPTEMTPGAGGHISHYFENDDHVREGKILIWDEPCTLEYQWIFKGEEPSILRFDRGGAQARDFSHGLAPLAPKGAT